MKLLSALLRPCSILVALIATLYAAGLVHADPAATAPATAAKKETSPPAAVRKPAGPKYVRVTRDAKGNPLTLDTAIVRFRSPDGKYPGLYVDLVSAIHIGEKQYYEELNKAFEKYDVVLYELVADKDAAVPTGKEAESDSLLSTFQKGLKDLLGLEFQLEHIDYTRKNFVHADMSPEDLQKAMSDRGETLLTMLFRAMSVSLATQGGGKGPSEFELLAALMDKDRATKLKRIAAEQFQDVENITAAFEGADGSSLITDRNKVVMHQLRRQLKAGTKRIAIFYGGGHMADLEQRIVKEYGLARNRERWITAWHLDDAKAPASAK